MRCSPTLALVLTAALAAPACAAPISGGRDEPVRVAAPIEEVPARLLAAHNVERARVGTPPLRWDDALAAEANVWAQELVASGRWEHDPALHGHGENLWSWSGAARPTSAAP